MREKDVRLARDVHVLRGARREKELRERARASYILSSRFDRGLRYSVQRTMVRCGTRTCTEYGVHARYDWSVHRAVIPASIHQSTVLGKVPRWLSSTARPRVQYHTSHITCGAQSVAVASQVTVTGLASILTVIYLTQIFPKQILYLKLICNYAR